MTKRIEQRWLGDYKVPGIEIRSAEDGTKIISGHGAVFNRNSQNLGGFVEQVAPTAFTKTIAEADVRALINHDANILLGRNKADTLTLINDHVGLRYDITPPDTTMARDWMALLERGDINQSSFSFRAIDVEWGLADDETPMRTLTEVALYDVGPVTFPAYLDADAGVGGAARSAFADLAERRSEKLETIIDLAQHGELRDLIKDGLKKAPPSKDSIIVTTRKTTEKRDIDPVAGSYEALSELLSDAIEDWAEGYYPANDTGAEFYVCVNATFTDRVVATVYGPGVEVDGETFQFDYNLDGTTVTLGDPAPVQLATIINPPDPDDADNGRSHKDAEQRLLVRKARLALLERRAPTAS